MSLPCLPKLPSHWGKRRLKHIAKVFPSNVDKHSVEDEEPVRLCNYTDVYYNEVITPDLPFMAATATPGEIARFTLQPGDVLFTKDSETADDIGIPAIVGDDVSEVLCGYHLSIVRASNAALGSYIWRLFQSSYIRSYFETRANGLTRVGLGQYAVDNVEVPVPPLPEQRIIAAYLDRETARIDGLVERLERLIALLTEKRQAVISHAVTKGLDPSAPMKDSGIDWLGEVPAHWEVKRVKWVARMESGHTPDKKVPQYWEGGDIPWVSLNDTGYLRDNEYISDTASKITQAGVDGSSARLLPSRVVAFSRDATIGRCAITTVPMTVSQHFIAWVCSSAVAPEFLLYCFRAMAQELDRMTFGATVKTIGMPDVRKLTVAVPSPEEQSEIIVGIRNQLGEIDASLITSSRSMELLKERRAALISAAVTGQIPLAEMMPHAEAAE